jgi:hypothetical protein
VRAICHIDPSGRIEVGQIRIKPDPPHVADVFAPVLAHAEEGFPAATGTAAGPFDAAGVGHIYESVAVVDTSVAVC